MVVWNLRRHGVQDVPKKAFLSYSRASEGSVQQICDDLNSCGIDHVWWDARLVGSQSWWDTILQHIRAADVVVCLIDEGMPESTAVRREYQYAIDLGKPLLPILLSDHVEFSTLPIQLAGTQYVDYRPGCPDPLGGLLNAVRNLSPAPALPQPLPPDPPIPISERHLLIEKVNSTEPLEPDVQIDVLSRLRRLSRSNDPEERHFAQASLQQLRNRAELLASVADDIDTVVSPGPSQPRARGGRAAFIVTGGAILLVLAAYLFWTAQQNSPATSESPSSSVDSSFPKKEEATVPDETVKVESSDTIDVNSRLTVATNSEDSSEVSDDQVSSSKTSSTDDQADGASGANIETPQLESSSGVDEDVNNIDDFDDSAGIRSDSQLTTAPPTNIVDEQGAGTGTPTRVATDRVEKWDVDFTVFEDSGFELCGYSKFTAALGKAANVINLRSADRSIPDQPFRGLKISVPPDQVYEIFKGCRILLSHEVTAGISRIRVRAKGAH
jgi:hypothetical protein